MMQAQQQSQQQSNAHANDALLLVVAFVSSDAHWGDPRPSIRPGMNVKDFGSLPCVVKGESAWHAFRRFHRGEHRCRRPKQPSRATSRLPMGMPRSGRRRSVAESVVPGDVGGIVFEPALASAGAGYDGRREDRLQPLAHERARCLRRCALGVLVCTGFSRCARHTPSDSIRSAAELGRTIRIAARSLVARCPAARENMRAP